MAARFLATLTAAGFIFAIAGAPANAEENAQNNIEAKVQTCTACHGQSGTPADPKTMPVIWGQQESYIVKQLSDYRNGTRDNPIMSSIAKTLQQSDLRPIAAYFAAKTWPAHAAASASASPPDKIAMCKVCHQQNFEGGLPAPRLAGLSYEYISAQMSAFADDKRSNNGDMPQIMRMFTPAERDAMAHYLAGL